MGRPVLIGHSRKRFLGKLLGRPVDELLAGTIGVAIALAVQGVDILRVHDVKATRDALARVCRDLKKMSRRDTRNITAAQDRETGPH